MDILDCTQRKDEHDITLIVRPENIGKVLGKGGATISRIRKQLGKDVYVVGHSNNAEQFLSNCFQPFIVENIHIVGTGDSKKALVTIHESDKAEAIGKNGRNVARVQLIVARQTDIHEVQIM